MTLPAPTYDLMLLLDPQAEQETRAKIVSDAQTAIEAQGEFLRHDEWGDRTLTYPIDRKADAEYHLLQFHAGAPELLGALDRTLRITDGVLRFRIIKLKPGVPDAPAVQGSPAIERQAEPDAQAQTAVEPEAQTDVQPPALAEVEPQAEADVEPPALADVEPQTEADVEPPALADVEPQAETDVEPPALAEVEPQAEADVEPEGEGVAPEPQADVEPEAEVGEPA